MAHYGMSLAGDRYSPLSLVTRANVGSLTEAWRFETGPGGLQTQPLMLDGVLYAVTPSQELVALDAATGKLRWQLAPDAPGLQPVRGLSTWSEGSRRRIFTSQGTCLVAVDARSGARVREFGRGGCVDLREDLGRDPATQPTFLTSPGVVWRDLIIVGFRTTESAPAAPGAIRAYDVRTGKLRWTFHTLPQPGEPGHETWPPEAWRSAGGGNAWAGMAVDEARGILYAPTGSAVPDFDGTQRTGDNLYANSLLALDAATGRLLWHFQAVHHDLWDRDFPSPPVLLTVTHQGRRVDAVAQPTKQGFLFVFDRVTGKSLFPIEERAVPTSTVPGEHSAPTQPHALLPAPFSRQQLSADLLTQRTPAAARAAREQFAALRSGGPFEPLAIDRQTVVFPGFDGGAEWGGSAADPHGVLYLNANDVAWTGGLTALSATVNATRGAQLYAQHCVACHGVDRQGAPPAFPALKDIGSRLMDYQIGQVIATGKGRMPGFPQLDRSDQLALVSWLRGVPGAERELKAASSAKDPAMSRYAFTGYRKFLDAEGYPAVAPPWGTLNAIDLNTGEYRWRIPFGEYPALASQGVAPTGSENYGGPLVTASGLLFIGATVYDRRLRAFDTRNGNLLWQTTLPYAGTATPITYRLNGRQYIVIAASGARDPKGPQGSAYIAFALPR